MIRALSLALLAAAIPAAALATPPVMPDGPPPRPGDHPPVQMSVGRPSGDALGDVWEQQEVAGWRAVWIRRGTSRDFDGYWQHPGGERVLARLEMHPRGESVTVIRRHAGGQYCRYDGRFSHDYRYVSGRYTCTWERTPMLWSARIVRLDETTPQILRPPVRRR